MKEGVALVGIAGSNFREEYVGKDEMAWAIRSEGMLVHRHVADRAAAERDATGRRGAPPRAAMHRAS